MQPVISRQSNRQGDTKERWRQDRGTTEFRFIIGGEYQQWENFSSSFDGGAEGVWDGPSDVGFGGFRFSIGLVQ